MIMLFTDFGLAGPYTGQVKSVLTLTAPGIPLIDLFADLPPAQPKPAAYLLPAYAGWFPEGSIFLCVVDPGVGSSRRALIAQADRRWYVGPENGLFELVQRRAQYCTVWEITWRPPAISASFHGRDLFAPVAARLALGEAPQAMARPIAPTRFPEWPDDLTEVTYIDRYGNAMTGIRGDRLADNACLQVGTQLIAHAGFFTAVGQGGAFWYVNSNGLVEIAVNRGRADASLGLRVGHAVSVVG